MSQQPKSILLRVLDLPLMLAAISTVAYYTIILRPEFKDSMLARLTTEHTVEYVIVALFFWGVFDIALKLLALPQEVVSTRQQYLPARTGRVPVECADALL